MKPEAMRVVIAEACGIRNVQPAGKHWYGYKTSMFETEVAVDVPDYPADLNAVREAVLQLFPNQVPQGFYHPLWNALMDNLRVATGHEPHHWNEYDLMTASAVEWSRAIVKTIGKWKEDAC